MKITNADNTGINIALDAIKNFTGHSYIISVCCSCGLVMGAKDGEGVVGISHGLCFKCKDDYLHLVRNGFYPQRESGEILA